MTKIDYGNFGERFYFEASGHAVSELTNGYSEGSEDHVCEGKDADRVCAALSILVLSLEATLKELDGVGALTHLYTEISDGHACFDVGVREEYEETLDGCFEFAMRGIALLEESYPELIYCV